MELVYLQFLIALILYIFLRSCKKCVWLFLMNAMATRVKFFICTHSLHEPKTLCTIIAKKTGANQIQKKIDISSRLCYSVLNLIVNLYNESLVIPH